MRDELVLTGCGVLTAVGQGTAAMSAALLRGDHAFGVLSRPGRGDREYVGAEVPDITVPAHVPATVLRTCDVTARAALAVLGEAWEQARLSEVDPQRIGLVVGGSNVKQRELMAVHDRVADRKESLPPSYAVTFLDSDLSALCSEQFGIKGMAFTVGGASASGQLAIIEAARLVRAGEADACVALGALTDLSHWELRAFRRVGAMGTDRFASDPAAACRPFDEQRDGFIFGECCAAVVVESAASAARRGVRADTELAGWAVVSDANRNPTPSADGQRHAITLALQRAGVPPRRIDYVNPHGSGSRVGDPVELEALRRSGVADAPINATKSIVGHGLAAAGTVEVVATVLQMRAGRLHATRNLDQPLDPSRAWVTGRAPEHDVRHALTLSVGFGGINTALCLRRVS
ncbi:MAG TPA: beta-ketoacyl synthase N-terminal-like domain-containing protein [Streptosporangiaceae bacterium]|nr:beta-ketoacyl synthase N-terminal-like domain-containing protein [Streptosporangiaceae bacterium]